MPQRLLGLDVGSHSLKAAIVAGGFRGFELLGYAEKERVSATPDSEISLGEEIAHFLEDYRLQADVVIAAMPGDKAAVRTLTLPARKIEQTLPYELEDQIPFPLSEVVYDHRLLTRSSDDARVLVAFCRRDDFDAFLDELSEARLDPRIVGVDALAYASLFGSVIEPSSEGLEAVIDIGHEQTGVCVLDAGRVVAGRTIRGGGAAITDGLSREFDLPQERAEKGKRVDGFIETDEESADGAERARISETIRSALGPVVRELSQTFRAVGVAAGNKKVERVHLCGGSARLRNLDRFLATRLDIEVLPLELPEDKISRLPDGAARSASLVRPLALALQGLGGQRAAPINFRRGSYAFRGDTQALRGRLIHVAAMLAAILALLVANGASKLYFLGQEESRVTEHLRKISKEIVNQPFDDPKKVLSIVQQEIKDGSGGSVGLPEVTALEAFREIANRTPSGTRMEFQEVNIGERRCKIKGQTDTLTTIGEFVDSMKKYRCFSDIQRGPTRKSISGESLEFSIDFDLSCHELTPEELDKAEAQEDKAAKPVVKGRPGARPTPRPAPAARPATTPRRTVPARPPARPIPTAPDIQPKPGGPMRPSPAVRPGARLKERQ